MQLSEAQSQTLMQLRKTDVLHFTNSSLLPLLLLLLLRWMLQ
jgi:hypothetical protein